MWEPGRRPGLLCHLGEVALWEVRAELSFSTGPNEKFAWNYAASFALIILAVRFAMAFMSIAGRQLECEFRRLFSSWRLWFQSPKPPVRRLKKRSWKVF